MKTSEQPFEKGSSSSGTALQARNFSASGQVVVCLCKFSTQVMDAFWTSPMPPKRSGSEVGAGTTLYLCISALLGGLYIVVRRPIVFTLPGMDQPDILLNWAGSI